MRLPGVRDEDLAPVLSMLRVQLGSSRTCAKFAAMRILNELSVSHPMAIEGCNGDLEALVNDANRSVATLAVSHAAEDGGAGKSRRGRGGGA